MDSSETVRIASTGTTSPRPAPTSAVVPRARSHPKAPAHVAIPRHSEDGDEAPQQLVEEEKEGQRKKRELEYQHQHQHQQLPPSGWASMVAPTPVSAGDGGPLARRLRTRSTDQTNRARSGRQEPVPRRESLYAGGEEQSMHKPRTFHSRSNEAADGGPLLSPSTSMPAASLESTMHGCTSSYYGIDFSKSFTAKKKMRERVQQNLLSRSARQSTGSSRMDLGSPNQRRESYDPATLHSPPAWPLAPSQEAAGAEVQDGRRDSMLSNFAYDVGSGHIRTMRGSIVNVYPDQVAVERINSDNENMLVDARHSSHANKRESQVTFLKVLFGTKIQADHQEELFKIDHWMNRYLIHPNSLWRRLWDVVAILLVVYTTFVLPARTAFLWEVWEREGKEGSFKELKWDGWRVMDLFIDVFFLCDVATNFVTGYYKSTDQDVVVMYGPSIAKEYAKGWMVLDILASIPLDLIVLGTSSNMWRFPRFLKVLRLSRLLRLLRLSRMMRYAKRFKLQENLEISDFQVRIGKLVCTAVCFLHWNACIQWLVVAGTGYPENSWAALMELEHVEIFDKYSWSLFRAMSHMLCIGYGLTAPMTLEEAWVVNVSMILGASLFAVFVGIITTLLMQTSTANAQYQQKLDMVNKYMSHRRLPHHLRQRIRDSYEYRWYSKQVLDENALLQELPVSLQTDVAMHNCAMLLESVPFFQHCEPGLVPTVVRLLKPTIFLAGDRIIRFGEHPTEMYFIQMGEVQVEYRMQVLTYLTQGSFFGEMSLVQDALRTADVHAVKDCELCSLSKDDLHMVMQTYHEVADAMHKIVKHRLASLKLFIKSIEPDEGSSEAEKEANSIQNKLNDLENAAKQGKARRKRKPRVGAQRVTTLLSNKGTHLKHLVSTQHRPPRLSLDSLQVKRNQDSFRSHALDNSLDPKDTPAQPRQEFKEVSRTRATISGMPSRTGVVVEQGEDRRISFDKFHTINERWKEEEQGEESESNADSGRAWEGRRKDATGRVSMDQLERRAGGASGVLVTLNKQGDLEAHVTESESWTPLTVLGPGADGPLPELGRAPLNGKTQNVAEVDRADETRKGSVESGNSLVSSSRQSLELGWSRAMEVADRVENEKLDKI